jgi:hypothetical protein
VEFFLGLLDRDDEGLLLEALAFLGGKMRVEAAGERIFELLGHPPTP